MKTALLTFLLLCPSRYLATRINESGGRAWVYYFSRQRVGIGGKHSRVYHGAVLPYVFDRHDSWLPTDETDQALTGAMEAFSTELCKMLNPGWGQAKKVKQ